MTIIPFKAADRVQTDAMADTESASSIPPWPVDISPRDPSPIEPDPIDGAGAVVVPVLVLAAVACAAVVAMLL